MSVETVVVTPASGYDDNGDPVAPGTPVTLTPLEIAPGNTASVYNDNGILDTAEFTLYLPLRIREAGAFIATASVVRDDYAVRVRERNCLARVQVWQSARTKRGGVVVLCKSATGEATRQSRQL